MKILSKTGGSGDYNRSAIHKNDVRRARRAVKNILKSQIASNQDVDLPICYISKFG
jgi:hypothetical protein